MGKTTGELLELLKKSSNASSYMKHVSDDLIQQLPLGDALSALLFAKGTEKSSLIRRSGLDRGYVYDILGGKKRPSRDKVLSLCFAMPLSADETQQLLKSTGYAPLYPRIERDSVILFGLQHGLTVIEVNELLYEKNHELLE